VDLIRRFRAQNTSRTRLCAGDCRQTGQQANLEPDSLQVGPDEGGSPFDPIPELIEVPRAGPISRPIMLDVPPMPAEQRDAPTAVATAVASVAGRRGSRVLDWPAVATREYCNLLLMRSTPDHCAGNDQSQEGLELAELLGGPDVEIQTPGAITLRQATSSKTGTVFAGQCPAEGRPLTRPNSAAGCWVRQWRLCGCAWMGRRGSNSARLSRATARRTKPINQYLLLRLAGTPLDKRRPITPVT